MVLASEKDKHHMKGEGAKMTCTETFLPYYGKCILFVFLSLLTSCVYHKHPSEWPGLISMQNEKCSNISGVYYYLGSTTADRGEMPFFSDKSGRTRYFRLIHDDEFLKVEFLSDDGPVDFAAREKNCVLPKNVLAKNEFSCTSDGINIPLKPTVTADFGEGLSPLTVTSMRVYLTKNTEGDIVLKCSYTGVQLLLFIPVPFGGTEYARFTKK